MLLAQSCPTLCNPVDCSLPGSSVHVILQARIVTGVGCHALLQVIEPGSPALQADSLLFELQGRQAQVPVLLQRYFRALLVA